MDRRASEDRDWSSLPSDVRLEETVTGHDERDVPDPDEVRNRAQHEALRDD